MKKLIKIMAKEILTLVLALLLVMAIGLLVDEGSNIELRNIRKFEIELKN